MRRRGPTWHPDVIRAMEQELATNASAAGVADKLGQRQAMGEFLDQEGKPLRIPVARSVQDYRKRNPRDTSGAWTFLDSAAADVPAIRAALMELRRRRGRDAYMTKNEANVTAAYMALGEKPFQAYVSARLYLANLAAGHPQPDTTMWVEESRADIAEGIEYRPGMVDPMLKEDPR